jgi:hypothetical protein
VVAADLDDTSSLIAAFRGAHAVFGTTDFFALMHYPNASELVGSKYNNARMPEACFQHELQQGRNMLDAAASVLGSEGVLETFVLSTLSHAKKWSKGQITELLHFDVKGEIEEYLRSEHESLARRTNYLQVGWYMDNLWFPFLAPAKQEDGTYAFRWAAIDADTRLPAVHTSQDVGVFARALVDAPHGTVLLGQGEDLTVQQVVDVWAQGTGLEARFEPLEPEKAAKEIDSVVPGFGWEFVENLQYYRDFGYDGGDSTVKRPKDLGISQSELTSFKRYVETQDWSSIL